MTVETADGAPGALWPPLLRELRRAGALCVVRREGSVVYTNAAAPAMLDTADPSSDRLGAAPRGKRPRGGDGAQWA